MGLFSGVAKGLLGGVSGGLGLNGIAGLFDRFTNPSIDRMSAAERRALEQQKAEEDDRKRRLLESQQRRTRVALGFTGGAQNLLYGGGQRSPAMPAIGQPGVAGAPSVMPQPGTPLAPVSRVARRREASSGRVLV